MSSDHTAIYECNNVSYHDSDTNSWKRGTFILNSIHCNFETDDGYSLKIPLWKISGLEKRQSSFIFASVVINVGNLKHWFSSFPRRDMVFNLIEMFWRESLLLQSNRKKCADIAKPGSALGKELMEILHESETTLVGAANALVHQSRQIEESQAAMEDINFDLNAAERFLRSTNIPSALLQTTIPKQSAPIRKKYDIMFSLQNDPSHNGLWEKGCLVVEARKLVVLDERRNQRCVIEVNDQLLLKFTTSWEFTVLQKGVEMTHVLYPHMPRLLRFLSTIPSLRNKLQVKSSQKVKSTNELSHSTVCPTALASTPGSVSSSSNGSLMQETAESISDEDISHILLTLNNLQELAAAVGQEQQGQLEKIGNLITDVERTELRIRSDNKNIKKSM